MRITFACAIAAAAASAAACDDGGPTSSDPPGPPGLASCPAVATAPRGGFPAPLSLSGERTPGTSVEARFLDAAGAPIGAPVAVAPAAADGAFSGALTFPDGSGPGTTARFVLVARDADGRESAPSRSCEVPIVEDPCSDTAFSVQRPATPTDGARATISGTRLAGTSVAIARAIGASLPGDGGGGADGGAPDGGAATGVDAGSDSRLLPVAFVAADEGDPLTWSAEVDLDVGANVFEVSWTGEGAPSACARRETVAVERTGRPPCGPGLDAAAPGAVTIADAEVAGTGGAAVLVCETIGRVALSGARCEGVPADVWVHAEGEPRATAVLLASGAAGAGGADGRWSGSLVVAEGTAAYVLFTRTADGREGPAQRLVVSVDTVAPDAPRVVAPPACVATASVPLGGTKDPDAGIAVGDQVIVDPVAAAATPSAVWSAAAALDADGVHTVAVQAIDACGHRSAPVEVQTARDTAAPRVTLSSPEADRIVSTDVVTVAGTVEETGPCGAPALRVCVGEVCETVAIGEGGSFSSPDRDVSLVASCDAARIRAESADAAGNAGEAVVEVPVMRGAVPLSSGALNTGNSLAPAVAVDATGRVVVVWEDETTNGGTATSGAPADLFTRVWDRRRCGAPIAFGTDPPNDAAHAAELAAERAGEDPLDATQRALLAAGENRGPRLAADPPAGPPEEGGAVGAADVHLVWSSTATVLGSGFDEDVLYRRFDGATGRWASDFYVLTSGDDPSTQPDVAVLDDGALAVAWVEQAEGDASAGAVRLATFGRGEPPTSLGAAACGGADATLGAVFNPRLAAHSAGTLDLVWERVEGTPPATDRDVWHCRREADGSWGPPFLVSTSEILEEDQERQPFEEFDGPESAGPVVATDWNGAPRIAWADDGLYREDETDPDVYIRFGAADATFYGIFASPVLVSRPTGGDTDAASTQPAVVVDPVVGDTHVAWIDERENFGGPDPDVVATRFNPGLNPQVSISAGSPPGTCNVSPAIAADAAGRLFVAWSRSEDEVGFACRRPLRGNDREVYLRIVDQR